MAEQKGEGGGNKTKYLRVRSNESARETPATQKEAALACMEAAHLRVRSNESARETPATQKEAALQYLQYLYSISTVSTQSERLQ